MNYLSSDLRYLETDPSSVWAKGPAADPRTPPALLRNALRCSAHPVVRTLAAGNPSTPAEALALAALGDKWPAVRAAALGNPSIPPDAFVAAVKSEKSPKIVASALRHWHAPTEALEWGLCTGEQSVFRAAAKNPNAPTVAPDCAPDRFFGYLVFGTNGGERWKVAEAARYLSGLIHVGERQAREILQEWVAARRLDIVAGELRPGTLAREASK